MIAANVRTRAMIAQERSHERRAFHREAQKAAERDDQTYQKIIRAYDRTIAKKVQADLDGDKEIAAILADASTEALEELGVLPEAPSPAAPPGVDGEPAPVVDGADPDPAATAPDGPAEAGAANDDRSGGDGADPELGAAGDASQAIAAVAKPEASTSTGIVHRHTDIASPQPIQDMSLRRVPRFESKMEPAPLPSNFNDRVYAVLQANRHGKTVSMDWQELAKAVGASMPRVRAAVTKLKQSGRINPVSRPAVPGQLSVLLNDLQAEAAE